jgi:hypothetical protein
LTSTALKRRLPAWVPAVALLVVALPAHAGAQTAEETLSAAIERYDAAARPDAIGLFDRAILQLEPERADPRTRDLLVRRSKWRRPSSAGTS